MNVNKTIRGRRLKLFRISPEMFTEILSEGTPFGIRVVKDPFPKDAIVVDVRINFERRTIDCLVHSESFAEAVDGAMLETIEPVIEKVYTREEFEGIDVEHSVEFNMRGPRRMLSLEDAET